MTGKLMRLLALLLLGWLWLGAPWLLKARIDGKDG